ncbi:MAG TPA: hypothetical protein VFX63_08590 [Pyrinomonadaceae bacterium]|nr:hypothetical protein [Pyrinomonadaceae bacterium]
MQLLSLTLQSQRLRLVFSILLLLASEALILAHFKRAPSEAATMVQGPQAPVQAELITVTPTGFEPSELTRSKGRFLLAIDNQSGLDDLEFYFERETAGRVNVPLSRRGKIAWREIVDLTPGTYVLRATNDKSWRCRITITAQ